MSYIVNQSRVHSLTINGTDYTSALVSWQASDSTANKQGFVSTAGQLVLGSYPGGPEVEDYERDNFKRGMQVILTMQKPNGTTYRHPRGLLYVVSCSYDISSSQLVVQIGCRLALALLNDDTSQLIGLAPMHLDPAQRNIQNIAAAFAVNGKYLYQDNTGALVSGALFDGDTVNGIAPGLWTSILGVTALSASPLDGSGAVPDKIDLTYSVPTSVIGADETGRIDTEEETSYYFIDYPGSLSVRTGTGSLSGSGRTNPGTSASGSSNDPCGNSPSKPGGNGQGSCQENYQLQRRPWVLPATRVATSQTYYGGPGAQVDYRYAETVGPALELNSQYFADRYAYCIGVWASSCQPGGGCPSYGMYNLKQGWSTSRSYFGEANEVVKTVQENWAHSFTIAQSEDWRSGLSSQGIPQGWRNLPDFYFRSGVRITEYYQEGNVNVQKTTTYASRGLSGAPGAIYTGAASLDAYQGVKTTTVRRSWSNIVLDLAPDALNTATTSTTEKNTELLLFTGRYQEPPVESGPYIVEESTPMPLLYDTQPEIDAAVEAYSDYLVRLTKGDAFGVQVAEGLREDVAENWYPGMPFRYYDPAKGKVLALRMDATAWGVTGEESAFVTSGLWCGVSNGTVTLPENVLGASTVTDGGSIDPLTTAPNGPTAPVPPVVVPPVIENETNVDNGAYAWVIKVDLVSKVEMTPAGETGVLPVWDGDGQVWSHDTADGQGSFAFVAYVVGFVATAGSLVLPTATGGIPVDSGGQLLTESATLVTADLFA